jgi:hypothetical protein
VVNLTSTTRMSLRVSLKSLRLAGGARDPGVGPAPIRQSSNTSSGRTQCVADNSSSGDAPRPWTLLWRDEELAALVLQSAHAAQSALAELVGNEEQPRLAARPGDVVLQPEAQPVDEELAGREL